MTARQYTCADLGVCNGGANCATCMHDQPVCTDAAAAELPAPTRLIGLSDTTDQQDAPLGVWESIAYYAAVVAATALSVAVFSGVAGWLYGRFGV